MFTVIWREAGQDRWDRLKYREAVYSLLKELKKNPNVCEEDVWVFAPDADNYAYDFATFMA